MNLEQALARLKFEYLPEQLDTVCEQAAKHELDYRAFLEQALATEAAGRDRKGIEARMRAARFPAVKTLEAFDFAFQPSIDRKVVHQLAGLAFVERAENVVLLGPPGVGKTHIAIALGLKAIEGGHRVVFTTLDALMTRLKRARAENRLERVLAQLVYPRVLILDEIGYLPLSREDASLSYRLKEKRRAGLVQARESGNETDTTDDPSTEEATATEA